MLPAEVEAELRELLGQRRRDAEERLRSLGRTFQEIVDASLDSNADDEHDPEGATIAFERLQVGALERRAAEDIVEIDAASRRLDAGTYGVCEGCGQPIPVARLRARPTARMCVACASVRTGRC